MAQIWKFSLALGMPVDLPAGAKLLDIQLQGGQPVLWALVDPTKPPVLRKLSFFGTGHEVETTGEYVATIQLRNGLVFHAFDEGEAK